MTKLQRLRYEMFVRVRNFGVANRDVFPESTAAGQTFAQVAEAVDAVGEYLTRRAQARAEARKVKTHTRSEVIRAMRAIAVTGRHATKGDALQHPFRMPARKSAAAIRSTARLFIEAAERRKGRFVELGMAPTFLDDFRRLVGELEQAIELQHDSRGNRRAAQAGLVSTLSQGLKAISDLDVTVANALADDPVRLAQWDGARHVEGQGRRHDPHAGAVPATSEDGGASDVAADDQEPASVTTLAPVLEKAS